MTDVILQDSIVGDPLEHLKAVVTEVTLQRNTGINVFFENLVSEINGEANTPINVACTAIHSSTIHVTQIQVSWTDTTGGTLKHRVYFRVKGDSTWLLATPTGVDAGTTEYVVKPLDPAPVYEFAVTSWDQAGGSESPLSTIVECFTTLRKTYIYQINETILAA